MNFLRSPVVASFTKKCMSLFSHASGHEFISAVTKSINLYFSLGNFTCVGANTAKLPKSVIQMELQ